MARRPADYTAQLQADQARQKQRAEQREKDDKRRKAMMARVINACGRVVLTVLGPQPDVDELAGRLLDTQRQLEADPTLREAWRQSGHAFFRNAANDGGNQPDGSDPDPTTHPGDADARAAITTVPATIPVKEGSTDTGIDGAGASRSNGAHAGDASASRHKPVQPQFPQPDARPDPTKSEPGRKTAPRGTDLLDGPAPDRSDQDPSGTA